MSSNAKMSAQQKVLMLEWMENTENRCVVTGSSHVMNPELLTRKWEELAVILNSCGSGCVKSGAKWRKAFNELRCHIKKKQRTKIADVKATGGGRPVGTPLTDIEHRYLNLFARVTVDGHPQLVELGGLSQGRPEIGEQRSIRPVSIETLTMRESNHTVNHFDDLSMFSEEGIEVLDAVEQNIEPVAGPSSVYEVNDEININEMQTPYNLERRTRGRRAYAATGARAERAAQVFSDSAHVQAKGLTEIATALKKMVDIQIATNQIIESGLDKIIKLLK